MDDSKKQLESLNEIRQIMERSTRFISLSGLSGILAGVFALAGAAMAYWYLDIGLTSGDYHLQALDETGEYRKDFYTFFFIDAFAVLLASLVSGYLLTRNKAKATGQSLWDNTAKRLIINLMIPLLAGGLFCIILWSHKVIGLIAPSMLLFYGLGLINASKYTLTDIRYLGYCEVILGLVSSVFIGYGLLFWATGFGVLHIIYGIAMYYRYGK